MVDNNYGNPYNEAMMAKHKVGRPKKKGECYSERFPIMLTPTQYDLIRRAAEDLNLYMGEWARELIIREAKKLLQK